MVGSHYFRPVKGQEWGATRVGYQRVSVDLAPDYDYLGTLAMILWSWISTASYLTMDENCSVSYFRILLMNS
jgi:hypothetical protein